MALGFDERYMKEWFSVIGFCEFCFLMGIVIESFKSFNDSGIKEWRFKKTSRRFWSSIDFKIQAFNQIPFGALANIPDYQWLRVLVLFKVLRIRLFLRIFEYNNYHQFFKMVNNLRMRNSLVDDDGEEDERSMIDHIKIF